MRYIPFYTYKTSFQIKIKTSSLYPRISTLVQPLVFVFCALFIQNSSAADDLTITEVAKGIYVHFGQHQLPNSKNHGAIANIGFIVGGSCVAVIDTGGNPAQGYALKKVIKKTTDKPICYVINSHVHPDHIYGNIAFKQPGTKFIGHHKLARAMAMRAPFYMERAPEQLDIKLTESNIIAPDLSVKKHMSIDLGGRKLTLTAHNTAHTDNDLTVLDQQTQTLWMSDLLFIEHIPVIDGSIKGWLNLLKRMEKNAYQLVIPGHGPVVRDWPISMQAEKKYLQTLITEIRQMIKKGEFLEDAVTRVGYSEKDKWKLFDQFHKRNITTAFAELEWEE